MLKTTDQESTLQNIANLLESRAMTRLKQFGALPSTKYEVKIARLLGGFLPNIGQWLRIHGEFHYTTDGRLVWRSNECQILPIATFFTMGQAQRAAQAFNFFLKGEI